MLNFGNKEFRNLQEQVLENAKNIEILKKRPTLKPVVVAELPEVGEENILYLVPKNPDPDTSDADSYDEYIWLPEKQTYEFVGSTSLNLSNMVTTDTNQTITGAKTFTQDLTFYAESGDSPAIVFQRGTTSDNLNDWKIVNTSGYLRFLLRSGSDAWVPQIELQREVLTPITDNLVNLGKSSIRWGDLYLGGTAYISTIENASAISFKINGVERFKLTGSDAITGRLYPSASNTFDLGTPSLYYRNLYLTGNISDGANTVSVSNIASKVTSTFISGTFDANGETTIDTEQAGTPEGLFIFTYGNCQCFLRLTAAMVNSADTAPIRVSCPMIYNGATSLGWLNITKTGYILVIKITDGTNHVDSGYAWTLTKTNLL